MKEINNTTDYKLFKQIVSNRETDPAHVRKLIKSISRTNLLHLNPIIVTENMEVVDGQHRLEAAEILGVPVYYVVDGAVSKDTISQLNSVKKNWGILDYINYWTINKAPGFDKLSSFISEHPYIQTSTVLNLLSSDGSRNTNALRDGQVNVDNYSEAQVLVGYLRDFRNMIDHAFSRNFVLAFNQVVRTGKYDHVRMMQKLDTQSRSLVKCINVKQYVALLEEIYNFRSHDQNKVSFRFGGGGESLNHCLAA